MTTTPHKLVAFLAILVGALALTACGSSSSGGSPFGGSASNASNASTSGAKAKAEAAIAPYVGHPSAFPVVTALTKRPSPSTTLVYMDCGTPICALFRDLALGGATEMGVKMQVVKTGQSADQINAAFNTVATEKPGAVMVTAIDPEIWRQPLKKLQAAKIPIVTTGIVDGASFGLTTPPNVA